MKANKHYWRGPAQVDQVVFEYFTNPDTLAEEMRAGLIDGCSGLLQAQMRMLAAVPGSPTVSVAPLRSLVMTSASAFPPPPSR